MRGLRGWIRNLSDGLGPPPGSVGVSAKPSVDNVELDLTTHKLGAISRTHVNGGSGSAVLADGLGHFGWDVELSPGPMTIAVTPTDPQTEYRKRFPDESAQIGKAYMTDIERLGWAAGRDCFIWDGIPGGSTPASAANWSTDPTSANAWGQGNGSIASFGTGGDAGKLTIRRFLAFLGGVVFSVELGDLVIPVAGESVLGANASGQDRWDLICLWMDNDPASTTYGKQRFEFTQGIPGSGVPPFPGNTATIRRLPFMAVKMAAGASVYSTGYDLRRWNQPPAGVTPGSIVRWYQFTSIQTLTTIGSTASSLNTAMASGEILLPPSVAWDGTIQLSGIITGSFPLSATAVIRPYVQTEGRFSAGDSAIAGAAFVDTPVNPVPAVIWKARSAGGEQNPFTFSWPISRIPAYAVESGASAATRAWSRLRIIAFYEMSVGVGEFDLNEQSLSVHLWPVP